jgi:hypothetical protein
MKDEDLSCLEQMIIAHMPLLLEYSTVSQPVPSGAGPHGEGFLCPAPPGGVFMLVRGLWPSEEGRPCFVARFRVVSSRPKRWVLP